MSEEGLIHKGHRQRMREKLISYGGRVFQNYELLEMLLFYAIPYKNTNPIAKRLMQRFGSLDGVFSASVSELCEVEGVGVGIARMIKSADALINGSFSTSESEPFDDYEALGDFIVDRLAGEQEPKTALLLFDNRMNLLSFDIVCEQDYSSGGVKAEAFISLAVKKRAAVAVTAHNHPHGPLFPSVGDMATNSLITEAFGLVDITHAEHYVVCGNKFFGISKSFSFSLAQSPELERFYKSRERIRGV